RMQIQESTKCWRLSQQLDKAITTVFKPVSNHNFNVRSREEESGSMPWPPVRQVHSCTLLVFHLIVFQIAYEKKKKSEGKMVRAERQAVLDMLFSAFEKHQHYNIKELVDITKQPVTYLKEILKEIGTYNNKGPHKSTWEVKPEYRH
ncbi:unnamed protein product, partial [Tetraodon nigroviridis]